MGIEQQTFHLAGPSYLNNVDWNNSDHIRSILASLVKGVQVQEHDRQQNRESDTSLAHPWWEFFGFKLKTPLEDDRDNSIFGAIYEFKNFEPQNPDSAVVGQKRRPPQYVVAFRGTMNKLRTMKRDYLLNARCLIDRLHKSSRFEIGFNSVIELIFDQDHVDPKNVWLVGYSQGASTSLIIGRRLVIELSIHLETYLFNPPFTSSLIRWIKSETLKRCFRVPRSLLISGVVRVTGLNVEAGEDDPFNVLTTWSPYLFVNSCDPICLKYVDYFKHRDYMAIIGLGEDERIATRYNNIVSVLVALTKKDFEPAAHLIPCAHLITNTLPCGVWEAHKLRQWWRNDLQLDMKHYELDEQLLAQARLVGEALAAFK